MPIFRDQRLNDVIDALLESYPEGLTTPELAERFGVSRQTSHKDITRLEAMHVPIAPSETRQQAYIINPRDYIRPLRLTLAQAWALYIPLRRMVRAQMHRSPVVRGLLQRLILTLDPALGDHLLSEDTPTDQPDADVLRILAEAWRNEQLVDIAYKPLNQASSRHLIAPYWFEPAVWSDAIYVIVGIYGYGSEPHPATLKLDPSWPTSEAGALCLKNMICPTSKPATGWRRWARCAGRGSKTARATPWGSCRCKGKGARGNVIKNVAS